MLADTGAARTTLLDRGILSLGLPLDALGPATHIMVGIGGATRCSVLADAEIRLRSDEGEVTWLQNILVARHDLEIIPITTRPRILRLPSFIGRDIIDRFRFVYEHASGTVLLER